MKNDQSQQDNPLELLSAIAAQLTKSSVSETNEIQEVHYDPLDGIKDINDESHRNTSKVGGLLSLKLHTSVSESLADPISAFERHLKGSVINPVNYDDRFLRAISECTVDLVRDINAYILAMDNPIQDSQEIAQRKEKAEKSLKEFRRVCEGSQIKSYAFWSIAAAIIGAGIAMIFSLPVAPALVIGCGTGFIGKALKDGLMKSQTMEGEGIQRAEDIAAATEALLKSKSLASPRHQSMPALVTVTAEAGESSDFSWSPFNCFSSLFGGGKLKSNPIKHNMHMDHEDFEKPNELKNDSDEKQSCSVM